MFGFSCRNPSEEKIVEDFLVEEGLDEIKKRKILAIISAMGMLLDSFCCDLQMAFLFELIYPCFGLKNLKIVCSASNIYKLINLGYS